MNSPTVEEIEKEILADQEAKAKQELAEKVAKRLQEFENARLLQERNAERARQRLLEPMAHQSILGLSVSIVEKAFPGDFPLQVLQVPETMVEILALAFGIKNDDLLSLSRAANSLVRCLGMVPSQEGRQLREKGRAFLESPHQTLGVFMLPDWVGAHLPKDILPILCGWLLAYKERKEEQDTLLKEEEKSQ